MASVVIQEPYLSPSQMTIFAKKVQTIIRRCMVSIGSTLGSTPSHHDIQQKFLVQSTCPRPRELVELRGALVDCLVAGHVEAGLLLLLTLIVDMQPQVVEERWGRDLEDLPHPPGIGSSSFQAPLAQRTVSSSFQAPPPPPYTVGSSTQHMPISTAYSSESDEHDDEPTDVV
ncbi:hypothetical protein M9H77_23368 [Catharanthus roseus]|uniref:Uncharacterized protein n=1 Tax=Catharanthus roseus TaxID=4058 RepID=A0ACC0AT57_CATRO|nr:hypothetical protein M9H77_23368 [Catharanthus roseus]